MTTKAKLLTGLIGLVLIWLFMLLFDWDDIEKDVAANASATLQQSGLDWVEVNNSNRGRDVLLSGVSRVAGQKDQLKQLVLGAKGVREVDVSAVELRPYKPASLNISRSEHGLTVSGELQSVADSDQLWVTLGEKTGLAVEGNVTANPDTEQPAWLSSIGSIAAAVSPVESSSVGIEKGNLSIAGVVRSDAVYGQVLDQLAAVSGINTVDASGLEVRPRTLPSLLARRSESGLSISGLIDSPIKARQWAAAFSQGDSGPLENTIGSNSDVAPAPWADSIGGALGQFAKVESGELRVEGGRLEVSGLLRKESDYAALIDQLGSVEGLDQLDTANLSLRPFKSSRFTINSGTDAVVGSGLMADKASAAKLDEAMETVFGANQSTRIVLDADVSAAAWIDDIIRLMPSMTGLEKASLVATDDDITLSGVARSRDAYELVSNAVSGAGEGKVTNKIALRPWQQPSLDVMTNKDRMEVVGMMPNQQALEKIDSSLSALGSKLGLPRDTAMAVADDIEVAPWLNSLSLVIPELGILRQPALRAADGVVTVAGVADSQQDADRVLDMVSTSAGGLMVRTLIKVEAPPEPVQAGSISGAGSDALQAGVVEYPGIDAVDLQRCETDLDSRMAENSIEFEFASAALAPASIGLLNILANALNSCPDVIIEVGGHTDNIGADDDNNGLSQLRAQAVVDYFRSVGVASGKLEARGYGSSVPIGDNGTEEGRAMNRRIEFNIKTNG